MGKYYARQCDPEWFDYTSYYNEDWAETDQLWAGGNRDFCELNKDFREDLVKDLNYAYDELERCEEDPKVTIDAYLKAGRDFTDEEYNKLVDLIYKYFDCYAKEENDIICNILSIIYGKPFITGIFRGNCQSEWMEYICPEELENSLNYIESVLFATGTEFEITIEPIESENDFNSVVTYFDYTDECRIENIKEYFAKNIGCEPEDIVLQTIDEIKVIKQPIYKNY